MIKLLSSKPDNKSKGFSQYGKMKSFRSINDAKKSNDK